MGIQIDCQIPKWCIVNNCNFSTGLMAVNEPCCWKGLMRQSTVAWWIELIVGFQHQHIVNYKNNQNKLIFMWSVFCINKQRLGRIPCCSSGAMDCIVLQDLEHQWKIWVANNSCMIMPYFYIVSQSLLDLTIHFLHPIFPAPLEWPFSFFVGHGLLEWSHNG